MRHQFTEGDLETARTLGWEFVHNATLHGPTPAPAVEQLNKSLKEIGIQNGHTRRALRHTVVKAYELHRRKPVAEQMKTVGAAINFDPGQANRRKFAVGLMNRIDE